MASTYDLPHIDLSRRAQAVPYTSVGSNPVGAGTSRSREQHGAKLRGELAAAYRAFDATRREDERIGPPEGAFLEVELKRGTRIEAVERKKDGIMPGASRREETDIRIVGLYVPDGSREVFLDILREYQEGELTPKGKPRRKDFVEAIESIRQARLETFWTDDVSRLPPHGREMWWEIWCLRRLRGRSRGLDRAARGACGRARTAALLPRARSAAGAGRQSDDRVDAVRPPFDRGASKGQRQSLSSFSTNWTEMSNGSVSEDLAERTRWPGAEVPAVCLLDTGVNRAHILIEPTLAEDDMAAVKPEWGNRRFSARPRNRHGWLGALR